MAKVDGEIVDLDFKIVNDCALEILTFEDELGNMLFGIVHHI